MLVLYVGRVNCPSSKKEYDVKKVCFGAHRSIVVEQMMRGDLRLDHDEFKELSLGAMPVQEE